MDFLRESLPKNLHSWGQASNHYYLYEFYCHGCSADMGYINVAISTDEQKIDDGHIREIRRCSVFNKKPPWSNIQHGGMVKELFTNTLIIIYSILSGGCNVIHSVDDNRYHLYYHLLQISRELGWG